MDESYEQGHQLRALAMRIAALEDNVAFLEEWCEEQQDTLDRAVGPVGCDYEVDGPSAARRLLRIVDLREVEDADEDEDELDDAEHADDADAIVGIVETENERKIRLLRARVNRLRTRLAATVAPADAAPERRVVPRVRNVSAKPAGRTAP